MSLMAQSPVCGSKRLRHREEGASFDDDGLYSKR